MPSGSESVQVGAGGAHKCIKPFSQRDLNEDLKANVVTTLVLHGADGQVVPNADSATPSSRLIGKAISKVYPGAPHGLMVTHEVQLNKVLLAFIQS